MSLMFALGMASAAFAGEVKVDEALEVSTSTGAPTLRGALGG